MDDPEGKDKSAQEGKEEKPTDPSPVPAIEETHSEQNAEEKHDESAKESPYAKIKAWWKILRSMVGVWILVFP